MQFSKACVKQTEEKNMTVPSFPLEGAWQSLNVQLPEILNAC